MLPVRNVAQLWNLPMAVREILRIGDPRLRQVSAPVEAFDTPELHALIADMFDTMAANDLADRVLAMLYRLTGR